MRMARPQPQRPPPPPRHRILFLDAYDSFTNNITALLTTLLDVDVHVLPIDSAISHDEFLRELSHYAAVVCGPGPGSPDRSQDVGLMSRVWSLPEGHLLPVLGVCLGFQSLVLNAGGDGGRDGGGAKIRRLRRGLHGMVRRIEHRGLSGGDGGDIFAGVRDFRATLYHSLCGDLGQDSVPDTEWPAQRWKVFERAPELVPLAWVEEDRSSGDGFASEDERVLMAVRHGQKPFWGLQYHPESICTEDEGNKVILNWFGEAMRWNEIRGRKAVRGDDLLAGKATRASLLSQIALKENRTEMERQGGDLWRRHGIGLRYSSDTVPLPANVTVPDVVEILQQVTTGKEQIVLDSANASSTTGGSADVRGRYSIVALDASEALRLEYHVGDSSAMAHVPRLGATTGAFSGRIREEIPLHGYQSIWHFLAQFHDERKTELPSSSPSPSSTESPFLGGFMGFVTYEQGLSGINVEFGAGPANRGHHRPDICFAWVTRSVVVDHAKRTVRIQHLHRPDVKGQAWIDATIHKLRGSPRWRHPSGDGADPGQRRNSKTMVDLASSRILFNTLSVSRPAVDEYESKVETCQAYIAAGESYELCLTDQTVVRRISGDSPPKRDASSAGVAGATGTAAPELGGGNLRLGGGGGGNNNNNTNNANNKGRSRRRSSVRGASSWQLFRALRTRQPAPFASYVRLGGATLVSSSPERFLLYEPGGLCSMRPMKGTVRKSPACADLDEAERILHVPKEEAENLMIVDLVRHDLHGICGAGNVSVRDLMKVEEYRSVFQMITVVEGQLPVPQGGAAPGAVVASAASAAASAEVLRGRYTGLDVLAASLPPGSMTGAPKKRSCEILQEIEGRGERSLYSGVVGYMCVSGRGDWSVTIRSLFRWDDEILPSPSPSPSSAGSGGEPEEAWHIGAGGAVTILSTPVGEREEMFTKLAGPLGMFSTIG